MVRPASDFNRLDPGLYRAFMAAVETRNFTQAARQAGMTQSGVSQHIGKLEEQLGVELFKRIGRAVLLTEAGKRLSAYIERYLDDVDLLCVGLKGEVSEVAGRVTYAMPGSCLLSPHLEAMLQRRLSYPAIELAIAIRPNEEIVRGLFAGELDFGFVTQPSAARGLELIPFCDEEFILVGASPPAARLTAASLAAEPFVVFPGVETYFSAWHQHYFPKSGRRSVDCLRIKGSIDDITGAMTLAAGGVGQTIVPRHCAQKHLDGGALVEIKPAGTKRPMLNTIFIASLAEQRPPRRVRQVIEWFLEMRTPPFSRK